MSNDMKIEFGEKIDLILTATKVAYCKCNDCENFDHSNRWDCNLKVIEINDKHECDFYRKQEEKK